MTLRCDTCGKFIAYKDIESGKASHKMITPDSEFTPEEFETLCPDCYRWALQKMYFITQDIVKLMLIEGVKKVQENIGIEIACKLNDEEQEKQRSDLDEDII